MRADRLVAVLLLLQRRGRVTAREVADELEISERTARRDLEALAERTAPPTADALDAAMAHMHAAGATFRAAVAARDAP